MVASEVERGMSVVSPHPEQPRPNPTSCEPVIAPHVLGELFLPLATFLRLGQAMALGVASRTTGARLREELARRDHLSKTLYVWGADHYWDLYFHPEAKNCTAFNRRQWCALPPMPEARSGVVCALVGKFLYVCGGSRRGRPTNSLERLNLETGRWEILPPLLGRRRVDADCTAAAVMDGQLYICGGLEFDGLDASDCADFFDPEHHVWETLPAMPEPRCCAAAVVADSRLFLCGGSRGGRSLAPLNSVIRFGRASSKWEKLPPMLEKRSGSTAIYANQNIYIAPCGLRKEAELGAGFDPVLLTSGERLNTQTLRWSRCPPELLSDPRASPGAIMSGCLYICGGSAQGPQMHGRVCRVVGTEVRLASSAAAAAARGAGGGTHHRALRRNWTT